MLYLRKVVGRSMHPTLSDGQIVVVKQSRSFAVGDVVVAILDRREVVKRITKYENGHVFLEGDNAAASTDSRHAGRIMDNRILGVVVWPRVSTKALRTSRSNKR